MSNPYQTLHQDVNNDRLRNTSSGIEDPETSGFWENLRQGWGDYQAEDASHSQVLNNRRIRAPRNQEVERRISEFPEEVVQAHTRVGTYGNTYLDHNGLAEWGQAHGMEGFETNEELHEGLIEELKERRAESDDMWERAGILGKTGRFGGTLLSAPMDLVNVAAMFIPGGQKFAAARVGGSVGSTAARTGAVVAGQNMLAETALQAQVFRYKEEIESPYTVGMAAANVAFASVAGLAMGAGSGAWRQNTLNRNLPSETLHDIQTARGLVEDGSPEAVALDAAEDAMQPIFDGKRTDVTPEMQAEVSQRAAELPDRTYTDREGVTRNLKQESKDAGELVEGIENMITCLFGAAT